MSSKSENWDCSFCLLFVYSRTVPRNRLIGIPNGPTKSFNNQNNERRSATLAYSDTDEGYTSHYYKTDTYAKHVSTNSLAVLLYTKFW